MTGIYAVLTEPQATLMFRLDLRLTENPATKIGTCSACSIDEVWCADTPVMLGAGATTTFLLCCLLSHKFASTWS